MKEVNGQIKERYWKEITVLVKLSTVPWFRLDMLLSIPDFGNPEGEAAISYLRLGIRGSVMVETILTPPLPPVLCGPEWWQVGEGPLFLKSMKQEFPAVQWLNTSSNGEGGLTPSPGSWDPTCPPDKKPKHRTEAILQINSTKTLNKQENSPPRPPPPTQT